MMADKLEVPRRKVRKDWYVGLHPDPVDRTHPDVHDDSLIQDALDKLSMSRKCIFFFFFGGGGIVCPKQKINNKIKQEQLNLSNMIFSVNSEVTFISQSFVG